MKYLTLLFAFSLLLTLQFPAFAQQDSISINTLVEKNTKLNTDYPTEKVYLHFDKPYYAVGDTVWIKAYITAMQNIPSPLSKIIYVDVRSEERRVGKESV